MHLHVECYSDVTEQTAQCCNSVNLLLLRHFSSIQMEPLQLVGWVTFYLSHKLTTN